MVFQLNLLTPEHTKALGKCIGKLTVQEPALIFLEGEMGAGKTTLVQGLINQLLPEEDLITSPTYTYLNTYTAKKKSIYHFDLYRVQNPEQIIELGLLEYLNNTNAIRLVEWASLAEEILPKPDLSVLLEFDGKQRKASLSGPSNILVELQKHMY